MTVPFDRRQFLSSAGSAAISAAMLTNPCDAWNQDLAKTQTNALDEFIDFDATGLAELIKKKEVTPSELVDFLLGVLKPSIL